MECFLDEPVSGFFFLSIEHLFLCLKQLLAPSFFLSHLCVGDVWGWWGWGRFEAELDYGRMLT